MQKKKLLIILGAGSSIPCGMPAVSEIDGWMKEWSKDWENLPTFPKNSLGDGIFNDLWSALEEYFRENPRPHLDMRLNFEKILGEMIALASWTTPSPFGNGLTKAVEDGRVLSSFRWRDYSTEPFAVRQLVLEQLGFLLEKLAEKMRACSRNLDKKSNAFKSFEQILLCLNETFDVGIYNLNYDTVATVAWPNAFTGFRNGQFTPNDVLQRREWGFIYHLHGSVHQSLAGPFKKEIVWNENLGADFIDCGLTLPNTASNFIPIPSTTLIAGGFKLDQLLVDPFQSFYASLVRHIHEADAFLICGYGFSDVHINRVLQNRYDPCSFGKDQRPPAVVITNNHHRGSMGLRPDLWAWELTHSLNTKFQNQNMTVDTSIIDTLIKNNRLETDFSGQIGIWHGGFDASLACLDTIIGKLKE